MLSRLAAAQRAGAHELVAGECDDLKAVLLVLGVQINELGVVALGVAAGRGDVGDQKDLRLERRKRPSVRGLTSLHGVQRPRELRGPLLGGALLTTVKGMHYLRPSRKSYVPVHRKRITSVRGSLHVRTLPLKSLIFTSVPLASCRRAVVRFGTRGRSVRRMCAVELVVFIHKSSRLMSRPDVRQ